MSRKDVLTDKDHNRHDIVNACVVQEIFAGEAITANQVVMIVGNQAFKYDPTVAANYGKAVGVATTFSVVDGAQYFADSASGLTTTPNATGILQVIAVGVGAGRIFVELGEPAELC